MKTISILLFFLFPVHSFGQTYSSQVPDSTILAFMNWEIKNGENYTETRNIRFHRKIAPKTLKFEAQNFHKPDSLSPFEAQPELLFNRNNKLDTLFSKAEMDAFFNQYNAVKDTVWSHKIKAAKIKSWKSPLHQYHYAVPLFSSDGKYVLIKKSFYCGNSCAYGGIYLYEKIGDNNWKLFKILFGWIS